MLPTAHTRDIRGIAPSARWHPPGAWCGTPHQVSGNPRLPRACRAGEQARPVPHTALEGRSHEVRRTPHRRHRPRPHRPGHRLRGQFEGTVKSVDRDNRTFRLHDSERGTVRIKVTRNTRFERIAGFSALRAGMNGSRPPCAARTAAGSPLGGALGRRRRARWRRPRLDPRVGVPASWRAARAGLRLRAGSDRWCSRVLVSAIGVVGIAGLGNRSPGGVPAVAPAPAAATSRACRTRSPTTPSARTSSPRAPRPAPATCSTRARRAAWARPRSGWPLAPADRGRGAAAGVEPRHARGARVPRERRARGRRHRGRHRGRGRADPDPRRDGQNLLDMRVDVAAQPPLTRRIGARSRAGRLRGGEAAPRAGARSTSASTPPRRWPPPRATSSSPKRARPRGHRVRLLPHGDRQPRERPARRSARTRAAYTQVYFDSTPPATPGYAGCASSATTRPTTSGSSLAAREIMRLHREDRAELDRLDALHGAKDSAEEVLHPPGSTPRFDDPAPAARGLGRRGHRRVPERPRASPACARDPRMGELARAARPARRRSTAACARRRSRWRSTSARRCARCRASAAVVTSTVRDEALPARLVARQPRGDPQLLAAHDRLGVRHRAPLPLQAPGAGLPVRARPPPVLDVIAWVREPGAIHVTASAEAKALLPLLERVQPSG